MVIYLTHCLIIIIFYVLFSITAVFLCFFYVPVNSSFLFPTHAVKSHACIQAHIWVTNLVAVTIQLLYIN